MAICLDDCGSGLFAKYFDTEKTPNLQHKFSTEGLRVCSGTFFGGILSSKLFEIFFCDGKIQCESLWGWLKMRIKISLASIFCDEINILNGTKASPLAFIQ